MNIKKRLDVAPFHDNFAHCLDECMISVTQFFGRKFILMYSQAWGFSLKEELFDNTGTVISPDVDRGEVYELLALYHGIHVTFVNNTEAAGVKEIILKELYYDKPVGVLMDTYYYSWDPNKNQHGKHWFLITGVDTEKEILYCTDPYFQQKDAVLDFNDFIEGYLGVYFTFHTTGEEALEYDWKRIAGSSINKIKGKESPCIFDNMIKYADFLEKNFCLKDETCKGNRIIDMPFYINLQALSRGRMQFALFLEDMASRYRIKALFYVAGKLREAGGKWDAVRGIMAKCIVKSDEAGIKSRIPQKIRDISSYESEVFDLLMDIFGASSCFSSDKLSTDSFKDLRCSFENTGEAQKNKHRLVSKPDAEADINKNTEISGHTENSDNYFYLNLTGYFNNNGFGSMLNSNTKANLSGTGLFFVREDLPEKDVWCINNMRFVFPKPAEDSNDNITCLEQLIEVPCLSCRSLMILATADFGSFSELVTIHYNDGGTEKIKIGFTEYIFEPSYGELIAWEGRACEKTNNAIQIHNSPVKIFANNYKLEKSGRITGISLPYLPNIHIFSITLDTVNYA
ncbi:butirosin biosynthesis protein H-like [Ruminiclostridium sufflavum DSM 19573]|uniref:Butirosin biosynthesis protein H-like n=1 Tax=Ruminiclostridium sufflavum DSM 19573 TaxID=1121337 RepID=A0A318XK61_9FIRM|nr:BtrH N-terminal domain-containing protein [Ruminiclostridium sufflavum]PYG86926.1 butirosin biosynthesis protein H-like [Ruminiclostridium sufflavum DSM 19573]